MPYVDAVANLFPHAFGGLLLATLSAAGTSYDLPGNAQQPLNVGATGDTLVGFPFAQFRIRRIVARNPLVAGVSGSIGSATLGLYTAASQGGTAIAAVGSNTLSNLTTNLTFQELTLAAAAANTIFTGPVQLYLNVGTAVTNGTCEVDIYGDLSFGRM